MEKIIITTSADVAAVSINGVRIPNADDGTKWIVYTDERKPSYANPWIDLRNTELRIAYSDCHPEDCYVVPVERLDGAKAVEIQSDHSESTVYLVKMF